MKIIKGDLIAMAKTGEFDAICHGANCQCTMGAGIAKQIAEHFPCAVEADNVTTPGDMLKLGGYTFGKIWVPVPGAIEKKLVIVANLYTQFSCGAAFEYHALQTSLTEFLDYTDGNSLRRRPVIGLPWIGCGIGGGVKKYVQQILEAVESESYSDLVLVEYNKNGDDA